MRCSTGASTRGEPFSVGAAVSLLITSVSAGANDKEGRTLSRFNTTSHQARAAVSLATSPLATVSKTADTRTFEGASGWTRTPKTELFLRACGAFHGGQGSFYESADKRDDRLRELVRAVALEDPQWCLDFATWLRGPGNMRTGALMFAVEFVHEHLTAGDGLNRRIINAVCQRADEPGEILAIWTTWYGRKIPKPVKRGVADAVRRLYSGKSLLKYDTASKGYRFGDILNLVHAAPDPDKPWQGDVFRYALDRRHNPATATPPDSNTTLQAHKALMALEVKARRKILAAPNVREILAEAGMTWEVLAGWLQGPMDKAAWEAMIPSMGIMALLRNLRNFDEAGVSNQVAQQVIAKLTDPEIIAKSRQFPFRFLSAHRATADSLRWAYPLEQALNHSLANVPSLGGRTLILVDRSPSMFPGWGYAGKSSDEMSLADKAAIFGAALALRAEDPTLVWFGGTSAKVEVPRGISVLKLIERFGRSDGTDIPSAVKRHYANHDRVIVVTDEQTKPGYFPSNMWRGHGGMPETSIDALIPLNVPVFMWNLAGYTASAMESGKNARFTLGGLTDKAFVLIPQLEAGVSGLWPWQVTPAA